MHNLGISVRTLNWMVSLSTCQSHCIEREYKMVCMRACVTVYFAHIVYTTLWANERPKSVEVEIFFLSIHSSNDNISNHRRPSCVMDSILFGLVWNHQLLSIWEKELMCSTKMDAHTNRETHQHQKHIKQFQWCVQWHLNINIRTLQANKAHMSDAMHIRLQSNHH